MSDANRYKALFKNACDELGRIAVVLGIQDLPNGPAPIYEAIAALQARAALASQDATIAALEVKLAEAEAATARLTDAYRMLGKCMTNVIVGNQSAWIEWQRGEGAEAAMRWVHNGLAGPGQIPDEDEPYGKEAQAWFDANCADPMPQCFCGRPSNTMAFGKGFCSTPHYEQGKAEHAAATKGAANV